MLPLLILQLVTKCAIFVHLAFLLLTSKMKLHLGNSLMHHSVHLVSLLSVSVFMLEPWNVLDKTWKNNLKTCLTFQNRIGPSFCQKWESMVTEIVIQKLKNEWLQRKKNVDNGIPGIAMHVLIIFGSYSCFFIASLGWRKSV